MSFFKVSTFISFFLQESFLWKSDPSSRQRRQKEGKERGGAKQIGLKRCPRKRRDFLMNGLDRKRRRRRRNYEKMCNFN